MKLTFRWFGEKSDTVTLEQIRQIPGCTGLMGFLDYYDAGEIWAEQDIADYIKKVHAHGLAVDVIESVNVHEDIKLGLPSRGRYIDNYCATIERLAKHGVKIIIYNFMPVFDWIRTDLVRPVGDGSTSLYYDHEEIKGLTPMTIVGQMYANAKGFSLPGWEPARMKELERVLALYEDIDTSKLLENFKYFLEGIIPTCEKMGVRMAVHPDDPPWPMFGLPRLAHSIEHFDRIVALADSPANSLCLCTGSLGASPENDIPKIIRRFGEMGRIACGHVRNVKHLGEKNFRESAHLSSEGSLDMFEIMKAFYDTAPDVYIRPDHGRMIWDEQARPGYGLYDRAIGLNYLAGLWEAIDKMAKG